MVIRASLTGIPPEIYEAVKTSGGFSPNDGVLGRKYNWQGFGHVGIDATWSVLHEAFSRAGYPLQHALEGDYFPDGGLNLFSKTFKGDSYLAYVSPVIVKEVPIALAKFPIKQSLRDLGQDHLEYFLPYFKDLVNFYREAADKSEAVFISIN